MCHARAVTLCAADRCARGASTVHGIISVMLPYCLAPPTRHRYTDVTVAMDQLTFAALDVSIIGTLSTHGVHLGHGPSLGTGPLASCRPTKMACVPFICRFAAVRLHTIESCHVDY